MNRRGFSLIELLTVIAIISVVLGIGVVKLNRATQGAKLKTAADMVVSILDTAKSVAKAEHVNCEAFFDASAGRVVLRKEDVEDIDGDGDTGEMIEFQKGFEVPSGISLYFTADNRVIFNPYSSVVSADDNVVVSAGSINKSRTISVNQVTGYITVS